MIKKFLKKIPGLVFSYRFAIRSIRYAIRKSKNAFRTSIRWFENELKRKERQQFARNVAEWNFEHPFSELVKFAEYDHDALEEIGNRLIKEDRTNPKGYALIQACLMHKPKPGHYDVAVHSLSVGNELVCNGKLKEGRAFFLTLQEIFPEVYEPYALLYDLMYTKEQEYYANAAPVGQGQKKPIVFSFSVWGDKYISFFNNYCIPSMMAEGNLPAVAKIRDIAVDIYAHREDIAKIKSQSMFAAFSTLCEINFIEFPKRLISCEGYKRQDSAFRYHIYGGFHHVSVIRARTMGADVVCLGPDNLHSNRSFLNYVKMIDDGYNAVLFTSTRAQAEFLTPVLDAMKDPVTKALAITSDEMVDFSAQYVHHSFLQYIVKDNKTPVWRSAFFIPYKNGFYIRSFHYHPVIISAAAIDIAKDITWDYMGVDSTLIGSLFPNEKDWESVKVITDSRDGIMLDVAYGSPGMHHQEEVEFSEKYLDDMYKQFNKNQFWNFTFTVDYRMEKDMKSVRVYLYDKEGKLFPKEFALTPTIEAIRKRINDWGQSRIEEIAA